MDGQNICCVFTFLTFSGKNYHVIVICTGTVGGGPGQGGVGGVVTLSPGHSQVFSVVREKWEGLGDKTM